MSEYNLRDCRSALRLSGDTGETLVVRTCGLDSNEQTADVELVRVPHTCGIFKFEATEEEQRRYGKKPLPMLNVWSRTADDHRKCRSSIAGNFQAFDPTAQRWTALAEPSSIFIHRRQRS